MLVAVFCVACTEALYNLCSMLATCMLLTTQKQAYSTHKVGFSSISACEMLHCIRLRFGVTTL